MDNDIAIRVDQVSKTFKLPHEKQTSIKGALINKLKGGNRSFERQHVLDNITFEVNKGEFFGIVGRNGSGKSTLLKMLAGIYTPSRGNIQVNGKLTPFIELGVGFNPDLTGRENVFLNGALLGLNRKEVKAIYHEVVEFAELERFMDQKLKNYSSGMQVRLAFAIAIRARSDILLLDEVLAVGDAAFQKKCFDYFRRLKKDKCTVVFISHDMNAVREYCDRAVLIEEGKVIKSGTSEQVSREYTKLFLNNSEMQESADHKRWGNNKARIKKITVSGETTNTIKVDVDYTFREATEHPIFGFYIHTPVGTKLVETNTVWSNVNTGTFAAGESAHATWTVPNIFTNGRNTISVAVANQDGSEYFDWWEDAKYFHIDKEAVTTAVALPEQKITIERKQ